MAEATSTPVAPVAPAALPAGARLRGVLVLLGPAFVAAVAYVDPGNFATNISAGAQFGMLLVWVILAANIMAMFIQFQTAKLGLATGKDLATLCREHFPRPVVRLLWGQAEIVAIATDLAEFVGAALALHLLFGMPPLVAAGVTAICSFALLSLHGRGARRFEATIGVLLVAIGVGFAYLLVRAGGVSGEVATGIVPRLDGTTSLALAVGMLGATVMPHVIYLHSALVRPSPAPMRRRLRALRLDIALGLGLAGLVNLAMLVIAAQTFFDAGVPADTIEDAYAGFETLQGPIAAGAFALALLISGISSASVGTFAGQVIMEGFLRRRIPLLVRRAITMAPAVVVVALGINPTAALIASQVVLSFGIPFALVPLLLLGARRSVMGEWANTRATTALAIAIAAVIIALNVALLVLLVAG